MSTSENTPAPQDISTDHAITIQPSGLIGPAGQGWPPAAAFGAQESPAASLNLAAYLHALRRHWLMASVSGLLCAALLAPVVWLSITPQYTASAYLRVFPRGQQVVFQTVESQADAGVQNAFEIYKETQQQLLKSRFVLTAALRNPKVKGLTSIQREDRQHNALAWLTEELRVGFPGKNAEIMQVSMTDPNPQEAATLVNAVVQAYFDEVINAERIQRRVRLSELQQVYAERENDVRTKRTELKQLADQLGTTDNETLSLKQQIAVQQFAEYRRELTRMQFELSRTRAQLQTHQAMLERLATVEVSDLDVNALAQADPQYRMLSERSVWQQMLARENQANMVPGTTSRFAEKSQRDMQIVQAQFEQLEKGLRDKVRAVKKAEIDKEIRRLESEVAILTEQEQQFQKDVERQRKEAELIGRSSIDVEMMRTDVRHVDQILSSIAEERERLKVELRSTPRVLVLGNQDQPADVPESETGRRMRLLLTAFSALIGLCVPVIGIAIWDVQAGRISVTSEVSKGLGLPVLGSLPVIPARVIRQLGSPSKRNQAWRMRLTESVDGVVARLLRRAELEQTRVILISSAAAGEGKTTLATQLAMSLARAMRRTVLVDFDLRRPALDGIFGLPSEPGVCEALRGQGEILDMVQPTDTENLSVVTAGHWDRRVLATLSSGATATLLNQLRANYDFVILDSSPILPIADTRLVSQHVDTVILSVFRDISQASRVLAAYEILDAFGVGTVEAVVTGQPQHGYGKGMDYEPSQPEQSGDAPAVETDSPDTDTI